MNNKVKKTEGKNIPSNYVHRRNIQKRGKESSTKDQTEKKEKNLKQDSQEEGKNTNIYLQRSKLNHTRQTWR